MCVWWHIFLPFISDKTYLLLGFDAQYGCICVFIRPCFCLHEVMRSCVFCFCWWRSSGGDVAPHDVARTWEAPADGSSLACNEQRVWPCQLTIAVEDDCNIQCANTEELKTNAICIYMYICIYIYIYMWKHVSIKNTKNENAFRPSHVLETLSTLSRPLRPLIMRNMSETFFRGNNVMFVCISR